MFQAPVSSSFVSSSFPESIGYCPEEGFVPGMNCGGNAYNAFSYYMPGQSSQEQEMQEPVMDAAELFAPRAAEAVKAEPAAMSVPCSSSPTTSDVISEATVIGATPNFASGLEASTANSVLATPVGCEDEIASGRLASSPIDSSCSSLSSKIQKDDDQMNDEIEQLGSVVKALSYSCSVDLGCKLPIKQIVSQLMNVDWNSRNPKKATIRLNGGAVGFISSNGKVQVKNARSRYHAQTSMSSLIRKLKKVCPAVAKVTVTSMCVNEISAQCDVGFGVNIMDMEGITSDNIASTTYDTNMNPARMVHLNPRGTLMIYHTGKCRVCGVKTYDDLKEAVSTVRYLARKYHL